MRKYLETILLSTEKYTRLDTLYFIRGGLWISMSQFGAVVYSFITGLVFANLMPREDYGTFTFIISIFTILTLFTLTGYDITIAQAASRGQDKALIVGFKERLRFGLIGSLIAVLIAGYYFVTQNTLLTVASLLIAVFLPLNNSLGSYMSFLQGKKLFSNATRYGIIAQAVTLVTLVGILLFARHVILIVAGYFLINFLLSSVFFNITRQLAQAKKALDKNFKAYAWHLSVMGLPSILANYIDIPLIFHFLGPTETAIYFVAVAPTDQVKALFKAISNLALPKFANRTATQIKENMSRHIFLLSLAALIFGLGYTLTAPFGFRLIFPQYIDAIPLTQLMAISFISFPIYVLSAALQATSQTKKMYVLNTLYPVVQLGLFLGLTPTYGITGAILSRVGGRIFSYLLSLYLFYKND